MFDFRVVSAFGLLIITGVAAGAPYLLDDSQFRMKLLAYVNFFTGGVFLGAGLIHMLPDAVKEAGQMYDYPVAYVMACFGFCLIWGVDNLSGSSKHVTKPQIVATATEAHSRQQSANICVVQFEPVTTYEEDVKFPKGEHPKYQATDINTPLLDDGERSSTDSSKSSTSSNCTHRSRTTVYGDEGCSGHGGQVGQSKDGHQHGPIVADHDHGHRHDDVHHHHFIVPGTGSLFLPLVLAVVFSIHSFIEGLALGVQSSLDASAVSIIIAILSHKVVEALTVGSNFVKENVDFTRALPVLCVYAFMSPLGIVVGMVATTVTTGSATVHTEMVLQSIAAGSFIYLCVHEVQDGAASCVVSAPVQVLLFVSGVGFMAALAIWV